MWTGDRNPGLPGLKTVQVGFALQAAALLGWVAVLGGDRVGAVIADVTDAVRILAPRNRDAAVLPILQVLVDAQPRAPGVPQSTGLLRVLTTLRPLLKPGSLVLLLSDFSEVSSEVQECLSGISLHNDCRLLWLTDPLERSGLPVGAHRRDCRSACGGWMVSKSQRMAVRMEWPRAAAESSWPTACTCHSFSLTPLAHFQSDWCLCLGTKMGSIKPDWLSQLWLAPMHHHHRAGGRWRQVGGCLLLLVLTDLAYLVAVSSATQSASPHCSA